MSKYVSTKVVGVSFEGRQDIIKKVMELDDVFLRREPNNPFDENAVAVDSEHGQIGYLDKNLAKCVAQYMKRHNGGKINSWVEFIMSGKEMTGVSIGIRFVEDFPEIDDLVTK